ncbi:glucosamine-6-phosphate deaminase [Microbacterium halimionae]|uniref:Glucosamine-6-phosphate deaminase n=1 Tax=Microbacterium halimionae TaxID=1526413 RepID=A0A7W3PN25_9MICO|nr:glucosamine-6-phosphate deaminase [Microbacterium halimionae]MBA8817514.1 glucosamine-6-phosphate deaminase [Microbacterium halimionae]NII95043.1 glucosamine-6-phosphate deaminase [Microbacterium halimionae]
MAEVVIVPDAARAGVLVAEEIVRLITRRPDAVLGVATGSTPLPVYEALRERVGGVDVSLLRAFALDEYVGIDPDHPESYRNVIRREVVEPLGLDPERVRVPAGALMGIETAGEEYEEAIASAGGIDLQILGIGTDGHIGFNEPGSSFASRTRVKTLTQQTREDNARFFESVDDVPEHCITQGLGTILAARHLVLLAFGAGKAEAVAGAIEGPVTASVPGSAIQLHSHVTVVVDEAAASALRFGDYYRYAWSHKPAWQGL